MQLLMLSFYFLFVVGYVKGGEKMRPAAAIPLDYAVFQLSPKRSRFYY